jgi:hypothetical protein
LIVHSTNRATPNGVGIAAQPTRQNRSIYYATYGSDQRPTSGHDLDVARLIAGDICSE